MRMEGCGGCGYNRGRHGTDKHVGSTIPERDTRYSSECENRITQ